MLFRSWETGGALRPLEETAESPWRGRGFVCASGQDFYARASDLCGVDLVAEPDKLLDPTTAADVLLAGLEAGAFTGESISAYFGKDGIDWVGARRTVGDMDQAHRTQAWLAGSEDDQVKVTGRYFYHQKRRDANPQAHDVALQEKLLSIDRKSTRLNSSH